MWTSGPPQPSVRSRWSPGKDLAASAPEYKELAKVDAEIPTIVLNRTYSPLKAYVQARAAELTDEGKEQARERYAVGVGVALLLLDQEARKAEKAGKRSTSALDAGRRGCRPRRAQRHAGLRPPRQGAGGLDYLPSGRERVPPLKCPQRR